MSHEFQPGDKQPTERERAGDESRLNWHETHDGPDMQAGDRAPEDRASDPDRRRNQRPPEESAAPLNVDVKTVHFSRPFIQRPVATFLLSLAIILAGAGAYKLLPVASLPEVEFPVISVGASLPGADPETMASAVATPLERQFSRIAGVNQMTSTSSQGSTSIILQFDLNRDINGAARDVQAAISAARAQLPANMPSNPTYRKINPADAPIMILALSSDTLTVPQVYDAADSILAQKLATIPGVGQTFVGGSSRPAVRIEANPSELVADGLSLPQLQAAVQTFNVNEPKGYFNGPEQRWSISTTDQLFTSQEYRSQIIATSRGAVSNAQPNSGLQSNVASAVTTPTNANRTASQNTSGGGGGITPTISLNTPPSPSPVPYTPTPIPVLASTARTTSRLGTTTSTGITGITPVSNTTSTLANTGASTTAASAALTGTSTSPAGAGTAAGTSGAGSTASRAVTSSSASPSGASTTVSTVTSTAALGGGGGAAPATAAASGSAPTTITTGGGFTSSTNSTGLSPSATAALDNDSGYTSAAVSSYGTNTATNSVDAPGIVRVGDVARVVDSVENLQTFGMVNAHPAILLVIFKSPGSNIIETVDNIIKQIPQLQASIPPAIKLTVALDRTTTIRASVSDITRTMVITIILVVLVVFAFLRELRSTLIPSVSVPLSILGTFGIMYLLGYTLDNLSLMALTICTGFVVDDAIVVIENISRHLEDGLSPYEAAMVGSREIGFTVLSMSISLIAVFIPILLMGGIVGRLFREFAVTLSTAILVSLVVSLTTTPMLSAKFLEPHSKRKHGRLYYMGERAFNWLLSEYELGLRWVLRHQVITLVIWFATFALNIYLFIIVPKGFFPQQDTGRLGGRIMGQQDISFDAMKRKVQDMTEIVKSNPAVENVLSFVGGGGPGGGANNTGAMFAILKPLDQRPKVDGHPISSDEVIGQLRGRLLSTPGVQTYLQSSQELNIGGRMSAAQYQYTLTADSVPLLNHWAPLMLEEMKKMPELRDVVSDEQSAGLETMLVIDRNTASRLGVTALSIDQTLADAFGQAQVSTMDKNLNEYHVVMEVDTKYQLSPDSLKSIYVKGSNGTEVPLSEISQFRNERIPLAVNHQGLSPATTISFNLGPGVSLSQATLAIERGRQNIGIPSQVMGGFQGTAQAFQDSMSTEGILILLALFAVYTVLGILYESFVHPITILSTLPSAGVGAVLALLITHTDMSVIAMIGIILLIGIVKKNAIMMIDFALVAEREHGKAPVDAIYEACMLRFRPIMMTTMAALLGGVPLAFGTGTGSELRQPLGITIVGGLIVSQCLTLFTTPVVYLLFDRLRPHAGPIGSHVSEEERAFVPVAGD